MCLEQEKYFFFQKVHAIVIKLFFFPIIPSLVWIGKVILKEKLKSEKYTNRQMDKWIDTQTDDTE